MVTKSGGVGREGVVAQPTGFSAPLEITNSITVQYFFFVLFLKKRDKKCDSVGVCFL